MPYDEIGDLPDAVKGALPTEAQRIWLAAYNSAYKTYNGDEQKAAAVAWQAVKNAGWVKEGDRWVKKSAAATPRTVTIPNVELVRTGTWQASTGTIKIAREDLEAMLSAASDTEVDRAPVRIGHVDPRFDGEPALGWVSNLRLHGEILVGDLVDVPAELADVIPKAFRRRSVEIAWAVRTPSGRRYRAALVGLALLGVAPPAVKGLEDVLAMYAGRFPQAVGFASTERLDNALVADGVDDPATVGILMAGRAAVAAVAASGGADGSEVQALLDRLDEFSGGESRNNPPDSPRSGQNDTDGTLRGGRVPLDEARIRELLGLEADADVEAELKRLKESGQTPPKPNDKPEKPGEPKPEPKPESEPKPEGEPPAPTPSPTAGGAARTGAPDRCQL